MIHNFLNYILPLIGIIDICIVKVKINNLSKKIDSIFEKLNMIEISNIKKNYNYQSFNDIV